MTKILAAVFAAALLFAACGDSDDTGATDDTSVAADTPTDTLPVDDGDAATSGLASGTCLAGEEDCADTGGDMAAEPLPDGGDDVTGAPVETVTGLFHIQDGVARLCGSFMESFPVQCGDEIVQVVGVTADNLGEWIDLDDSTVWDEQGVVWVDEPVTLIGVIEDGVLTVG